MYTPQRAWTIEKILIRGVAYHIRKWTCQNSVHPPLFLLHGWMDVGASFQLMVDEMAQDRTIIAPDWRGFGETPAGETDTINYLHYLGDLDTIIHHYSPQAPVDILGHSMGGNVVMVYAAIRPQKVRRIINAEGFGPPNAEPEDAPKRLSIWLDDIRLIAQGELRLKSYQGIDSVKARLQKTNPRLNDDKAAWLALQWAYEMKPGVWQIRSHPAHLSMGAHMHRLDEMLIYYQTIQCPVLFVKAEEDSLPTWWRGAFTMAQFDERIKNVACLKVIQLTDCCHMLHHDQPTQLARAAEVFLNS